MGVLIRELAESYDDETSGKPPAGLPPLPVQYADFARWQRERLTDDVLEQAGRVLAPAAGGSAGAGAADGSSAAAGPDVSRRRGSK